MATLGSVKSEDRPAIKPDPDGIPPIDDDDDEYEDTGELEFPPVGQEQRAWLARLPKWLWEVWADIAEEEEIELGKVRVYNNAGPGKTKIKMILHDIPGHATVPKKYDMDMTKTTYNNTVVFSEKDQPGFAGNRWNRTRIPAAKTTNKISPDKVSKKPFKSSIAKQTAMAGFLEHEVSVLAVENDEYREKTNAWLANRNKKEHKLSVQLFDTATMHPGQNSHAGYAAFTSASAAAKTKQKRQQEKAVRLPENQLLDLLVACFNEYRYWSLRALKQRLHQPETHIKTVIDKIATLVRSGPFAMNYQLNPEYGDMSGAKAELAAEEEGDTDDDMKLDPDNDNGDGDGNDFEDIKMEGS